MFNVYCHNADITIAIVQVEVTVRYRRSRYNTGICIFP